LANSPIVTGAARSNAACARSLMIVTAMISPPPTIDFENFEKQPHAQ